MSQKIDAFGTVLQLGNIPVPPAVQVFTNVAGLTNITGPRLSTNERDATTHDSPRQGAETRPGFIDGGSVDVEGYYDPNDASHEELITAWANRQVRDWKIGMVDENDTTDEFAGFISAFEKTAPHDNLMGFTMTIRLSEVPSTLGGVAIA